MRGRSPLARRDLAVALVALAARVAWESSGLLWAAWLCGAVCSLADFIVPSRAVRRPRASAAMASPAGTRHFLAGEP